MENSATSGDDHSMACTADWRHLKTEIKAEEVIVECEPDIEGFSTDEIDYNAIKVEDKTAEEEATSNTADEKQHKCKLCYMKFFQPEHLIKHLRGHADSKQCVYEEKHSETPFQTCKEMVNHRAIIHTRAEEKFCNGLNIHFNNLADQTELTLIEDGQIFCKYCNKSFKNLTALYGHSRIHQAKKLYVYNPADLKNCDDCEASFEKEEQLSEHIKNKHSNNNFLCKICTKVFINLAALKRHSKAHVDKKFSCSDCGKLFEFKKQMKQHILRGHPKGDFICKICKKHFLTIAGLKIHSKSHAVEREYKTIYTDANSQVLRCTECSNTFETVSNLKRHLKSHSNVKNYSCKICFKCFKRMDHLKRHLLTHTEEERLSIESNEIKVDRDVKKRFKCKVCLKVFAENYYLRQHLASHSDVRAFYCRACGARFKRKYHLDRHIVTHHSYTRGDFYVNKTELDRSERLVCQS